MKALSIKQPWIGAILHRGKTVENRTWPIPAQYVGARILLHASAAPVRRGVLPTGVAPLDSPVPFGAILGIATLTGCHLAYHCCRPWGEPSVFHWQLADVAPLAVPVPAKGRLQFWTPTEDVLAAIELPEVAW